MSEQWDMCSVKHCVICPECAFTFDGEHTTIPGDDYTCPACAEIKYLDRIERLEAALRFLAAESVEQAWDKYEEVCRWCRKPARLGHQADCPTYLAREALGGDNDGE